MWIEEHVKEKVPVELKKFVDGNLVCGMKGYVDEK